MRLPPIMWNWDWARQTRPSKRGHAAALKRFKRMRNWEHCGPRQQARYARQIAAGRITCYGVTLT